MTFPFFSLLLATLTLAGCDEKKPDLVDAATLSAPLSSAPAGSATTVASAPAAASATSSAAPVLSARTKDVTLTVKDPEKEPTRTVKAIAGGTATLYLPKWAGTAWSVSTADKALGKPSEETLLGFDGPTPAASFVWKLAAAKAGKTYKVQLVNKNTVDKAASPKTFTLTIDVL